MTRLAGRGFDVAAAALLAVTALLGVAALGSLPPSIAVHWTVGLDGGVTADATLPRRLGVALVPVTAVAAFVALRVADAAAPLDGRDARWYRAAVAALLCLLLVVQSLLVWLNLR
ncbi:MAG: hypothetical protein ABEJ22_03190 [Haloferacaceae archaeon]